MRRFKISFLAVILALGFPVSSFGATEITLDSVSGHIGGDTVLAGYPLKFILRLTYTPGDSSKIAGISNGFEVYEKHGGNFYPALGDTIPAFQWGDVLDAGFYINMFSMTGTGSDTIGFSGASLAGGVPDGTSAPVWYIETGSNNDGDTLCIDSTFFRPASNWVWGIRRSGKSLDHVHPDWYGPYCFHVYQGNCMAPPFDVCVSDLYVDHCQLATYDFDAPHPLGGSVVYKIVSGPGSIDPATGVWSYMPSFSDLMAGPTTLTVEACDSVAPWMCDQCITSLHFTNNAPVFTDGCGYSRDVCRMPVTHQMTATDDCDSVSYILWDINPFPPVGPYSLDVNTGELSFKPAAGFYPVGDEYMTYTFTVAATDGVDTTAGCAVDFVVSCTEAYEVQIEKTHNAIQGQHEYVDVVIKKGAEDFAGYDLLMSYDRSALNFQSVIPGPLHRLCSDGGCGWEYFTYRTWFWPSYEPHFFWAGIVRTIALAELNNGANHPCCYMMNKPFVLFTLDFLVTDNRLFECQFAPISFFWADCNDNAFSSVSGDSLFIVLTVQNFEGNLIWDEGDDDLFPEDARIPGVGAPDYCLNPDPEKPSAIRFIDFINGGVDIVCADSIDDRGDINLNGVAHEIADATVFTNYFIYGLSAFHININGQVAATDCNADGLALTVGDLVYLVRVIVGDAPAYAKLTPVEATYAVDDQVVSVDRDMGAALVVVEGNAEPTLLAEQMEMKYAYNADENVTRILIWSPGGNGFSGNFLDAGGDVVSIELGSHDGAVVKTTQVPTDYALHQNYPNPFNPTTTISFSLPVASDYTVTVYNVRGRQVALMTGAREAGLIELEWDAADMASGVYFYRLDAGNFTATKKMVLMK
ncbi:MAG: T9SS type A sorting domain-containing protein [bacterium]